MYKRQEINAVKRKWVYVARVVASHPKTCMCDDCESVRVPVSDKSETPKRKRDEGMEEAHGKKAKVARKLVDDSVRKTPLAHRTRHGALSQQVISEVSCSFCGKAETEFDTKNGNVIVFCATKSGIRRHKVHAYCQKKCAKREHI